MVDRVGGAVLGNSAERIGFRASQIQRNGGAFFREMKKKNACRYHITHRRCRGHAEHFLLDDKDIQQIQKNINDHHEERCDSNPVFIRINKHDRGQKQHERIGRNADGISFQIARSLGIFISPAGCAQQFCQWPTQENDTDCADSGQEQCEDQNEVKQSGGPVTIALPQFSGHHGLKPYGDRSSDRSKELNQRHYDPGRGESGLAQKQARNG